MTDQPKPAHHGVGHSRHPAPTAAVAVRPHHHHLDDLPEAAADEPEARPHHAHVHPRGGHGELAPGHDATLCAAGNARVLRALGVLGVRLADAAAVPALAGALQGTPVVILDPPGGIADAHALGLALEDVRLAPGAVLMAVAGAGAADLGLDLDADAAPDLPRRLRQLLAARAP